jgi:hypothetical protein
MHEVGEKHDSESGEPISGALPPSIDQLEPFQYSNSV